MTAWYRIFGTNETQPAPAAVLEHLQQLGYEARGHFKGDDLGWFTAQLTFSPDEPAHVLERFLVAEEDIRNELNTWAAWLETTESPHTARLMQHMISTRQLFTLHVEEEDEDSDHEACVGLCRFLAQLTDGVYQIDGQGFFDADGRLLIAESAPR